MRLGLLKYGEIWLLADLRLKVKLRLNQEKKRILFLLTLNIFHKLNFVFVTFLIYIIESQIDNKYRDR